MGHYFLFLCFLISSVAVSAERPPEPDFYLKNKADNSVIQILDSSYQNNDQTFRLDKLKHDGQSAGIIYQLTVKGKQWLLKQGVHRLFQRAHMQGIINLFGLSRVKIPEKKLYHIPGHPWTVSDKNYLVVSEFISGQKIDFQITDTEIIYEILLLSMASLWSDAHSGNFVRSDGITWLIDAEPDVHSLKEKSDRLKHKVMEKLTKQQQTVIKSRFSETIFKDHFAFLTD